MKNSLQTNIRRFRVVMLLVAMIALYALGVGIRRYIVETQVELVGGTLPFTLESALQFQRTALLANEGSMDEVASLLQHPEGIDPWKTYSVGSEYVYAMMASLVPPSVSMESRIRWIEVLWFCLTIPLLGLWIRSMTRSTSGGLTAAAFYAVVLIAVLRSTGLELSRENFAFPFLAAHLWAHAVTIRTPRKSSMFLSAFFLAMAAASWDMIQYYVLLWAICMGWHIFRRREPSVMSRLWIWEWGGLLLISLLHPYMRAHGWFFSLPMAFAGGLLCILYMRHHRTQCSWKHEVLILSTVVVLCLTAGRVWSGGAYSHFAELLWAKIRYMNVKPTDPSLLTFEQRIMWVPALHSANWALTKMLMPFMLPVSIGAFLLLLFGKRKDLAPETGRVLFYFIISLSIYVFFVRFYVFAALFGCAVIGMAVAYAEQRSRWFKWVLMVVLACGWTVEAAYVVSGAAQWGRPNIYYNEADQLIGWMKKNIAPRPVLANFGISSSLAAYAGCPVVLHPKFENKVIRERVQDYAEALFKKDEKVFRDWCDTVDTDIYVYSRGEFARRGIPYQMRYFVDAVSPPDDAAARLFEYRPTEGRYFKLLWENRKYRVFQIVSGANEEKAKILSKLAWESFQEGELDAAEEWATDALALDAGNTNALRVVYHIQSLKKRGFLYEPEQVNEQ